MKTVWIYPCPECGQDAERWEDPTGWGYQCHAKDCYSLTVMEEF